MSSTSRQIQCPFFLWDEKKKLHCEGGVLTLPGKETNRYMDRYCAHMQGWKDCPIAKSLTAYYDSVDGARRAPAQ